MYIICKDSTNVCVYCLQDSYLQACGQFNRIQVSGTFETHPDLILILHSNIIIRKLDSSSVPNA
jgi:hypothetical protein